MKKKTDHKADDAIQKEMAEAELGVAETVEAEVVEGEVLEEVQPDTAEIIKQKDAELASMKDKLMRQLAEFDNFRKRSIKEKQMANENGIKEVTLAILPVIDNFDRALNHVKEENKEDPFVLGIQMIQKQMVNALAQLSIVEIEALGKPCDHNFHEVVSHIEDEQYGENEIIEVYQKGYIFKETVIRHSMVKTAN